ncbi:hypothetical protein Daus18300_009585 [Diaporthe australafricana]|uniref:Uncharacterized protein n=1 Tax=Diaporthe australafricana TaxID=127596 RepID=A0ABR3WDZ3_9PEZI
MRSRDMRLRNRELDLPHELAGTEIVVQRSRYEFWQIETRAPVAAADEDELVVEVVKVLAIEDEEVVGVGVAVVTPAVSEEEEEEEEEAVVPLSLPLVELLLLSPTPSPAPSATPSTTMMPPMRTQNHNTGRPSILFLWPVVAAGVAPSCPYAAPLFCASGLYPGGSGPAGAP